MTVRTPDNQKAFELEQAEEQALLEAASQADAGIFVDGDDLLNRGVSG